LNKTVIPGDQLGVTTGKLANEMKEVLPARYYEHGLHEALPLR
jgi:hypothetical protein